MELSELLEEFRDKWAASSAAKAAGDLETTTSLRNDCRELAGAVCATFEDDLQRFAGLEREHLVNLMDIARVKEDRDEATLIDMWLLAFFDPQVIKGNFRAPAPGTRGRR